MAYKMKGFKGFDFKSKKQGLSKAKKEARKTASQKIFMEDASHEGLMAKGKKLGQAMKEISKYTDY